MPRHPRVHLPDVPLHIVQRGHNRRPCFFCIDDYRAYLHRLRIALGESGVALHAYCLMTNHVHLLITPSDVAKIPQLMMSVGRRYVQYINRNHERTGTLWDSRYKSCLIETERYLFACQRYIELNPVRAGMVDDPARYRWSSYRCNALGRFDPLLTPRAEYLALGEDHVDRQSAYRRLFEDALANATISDIRRAVDHGQPLGTAQFRSAIETTLGRRCEVRAPGRPRKSPSPANLSTSSENDLGALENTEEK